MKRIALDRLESQIPEAVLRSAELLEEQTGIPYMEEADDHLWVAGIRGVEVEILLNGRSTSQYTCECERYNQEQMCEHLALALLSLRSLLTMTKSLATSGSDSQSTGRVYGSKRLTTAALLEHADEDRLKAFIKAYARENRSFALAFRARFSSQVPTSSEEEKYRNLLNSIFNSQYKPGKPYTATATAQVAQLLHYVIQDLAEQVTLGQFQSPVLMVRILIEKLPPVLNLAGDEKEVLLKMLRKGLKLLERMASEPVSPDLKDELWSILETELPKPYCIKNDLHINILDLLMSLAPELGRETAFLNLLVSMSSISFLTVNQRIQLQALQLHAMGRMDHHEQVRPFINTLVYHPEQALGVLQFFLDHKPGSPLMPLLVNAVLEADLPVDDHAELSEELVSWLKSEGRLDDALDLAVGSFLKRPEAEMLNRCRQLAGDRWDGVFNQLLDGIRNHPKLGRDEKNRQVAAMLFEEGRTAELLRHLSGQESLALLRRYTPSLLPDAQSLLLEVYFRYFENYLREYLGRKPAQRVRNTIESLRQDGACKLADDLLIRIRQSFPQRRSLIEELEML